MAFDADVIVVGGGVIGLSTAYQLCKRSYKVVLLEQAPSPNNLNGGSHGDSRIIRLIHSDPVYLPMAIESYKYWRQLEHEVGSKLFENHGVIWMGDKGSSVQRSNVLRQFDAPHELLDPGLIRSRYPHIHYNTDWWSVLDHTAGTIYARKSNEALSKYLISHGVIIKYGHRVINWSSTIRSVTATTTCGRFSAKNIVFATGAWLDSIVPGLNVKVTPGAVGVFFWDVENEGEGFYNPENKAPNIIISDFETKDELFMIPNADYKNKVKFGLHLAEPFDITKEKPTAVINKCREVAASHIKKHYKYLKTEPTIETTCLYANTDDRSFIIDRHPKYSNVILAGGFSGTGFKFGPVVGEIVCDLIEKKKTKYDISAFHADRFIDISKAKL